MNGLLEQKLSPKLLNTLKIVNNNKSKLNLTNHNFINLKQRIDKVKFNKLKHNN